MQKDSKGKQQYEIQLSINSLQPFANINYKVYVSQVKQ